MIVKIKPLLADDARSILAEKFLSLNHRKITSPKLPLMIKTYGSKEIENHLIKIVEMYIKTNVMSY